MGKEWMYTGMTIVPMEPLYRVLHNKKHKISGYH